MQDLLLYLLAADEMGWLDYASRVGVIGILVVSHYGFYKGWWVWGPTHMDLFHRYEKRGEMIDRLIQEKDAWKEQALTGTRVAERSSSIAAEAMRRGRSAGE